MTIVYQGEHLLDLKEKVYCLVIAVAKNYFEMWLRQ